MWMARATSSLPVPVSPTISTGLDVRETRSTTAASSRMAGSSSAQRCSARGQRVRNRQPLGGETGGIDKGVHRVVDARSRLVATLARGSLEIVQASEAFERGVYADIAARHPA